MATFQKQGMKIEKIQIWGFDNAIRGMRFPLNSELQSDSKYGFNGQFDVGPKDLDLILRLTRGGNDHAKVLRMIHVQAAVQMPFTFWKHWETYKVATTAISRSTMHKGVGKELLTKDNFYVEVWNDEQQYILDKINDIQEQIFKADEDKDIELRKILWRRLIDALPLSLVQERMVDLNYQVLVSMLCSRYKVEKLSPEWDFLCEAFLHSCPYLEDIYNVAKSKRSLTTEEFNKLTIK